eukprot:TRINITY_DN16239_c0_g1_i1.p1 TRINITY_DN16239_c0_g1~~TRINITY_DN16239_c0_g1_i1.p1  ORF type:complete len:284 (-),score=85.56 TRINITY_DN16239_c0_g1_i1:66-890(-)
MGCKQSKSSGDDGAAVNVGAGKWKPNAKDFQSVDQVRAALQKAGLESCNLIIGIDFTKSNTWNGKNSFNGKCLHYIDPSGKSMNPYQSAIDIIGRTLEDFDDDKLFPSYGFGDLYTTDKAVFPFFPDDHPCHGIAEVLRRYTEITPGINLCGPTSFVPIIDKAIEIVEKEKGYHILVIIADGQVSSLPPSREALIRASKYPISIVMIGVGDGPWNEMEEFDEGLPQRLFDNFHYVNFHEVMARKRVENFDAEFALEALMEIPPQYKAIRKLGYI